MMTTFGVILLSKKGKKKSRKNTTSVNSIAYQRMNIIISSMVKGNEEMSIDNV